MRTAAPRVAYLGPAGTHTDEALRASALGEVAPDPRATVHEAIMAVQRREVEQAIVPIENSLAGGVAATDAGPCPRMKSQPNIRMATTATPATARMIGV